MSEPQLSEPQLSEPQLSEPQLSEPQLSQPQLSQHGAVSRAPRIGLVLGAGGVVGHAFHAGVLSALADSMGWDPRSATVIVGTSAGSLVGALLRAGISPTDLAARAEGLAVSPEAAALLTRAAAHRAAAGPIVPPAIPTRAAPRFGPMAAPERLWFASWRPWAVRPGTLAAAVLPAGEIPTELISLEIEPLFGGTWPAAALWLCAVRLHDGRRVVFGRDGAPAARVDQAVAASCAIPAFFRPVTIGRTRYVDGGAWSPTNADLMAKADVDLVVVSSPMSIAGRPELSVDLPTRRLFRSYLNREVRRVRAAGTPVVTFQPGAGDRRVMGLNAMDPRRRAAVVRQVRTSALSRLDRPDIRARLAALELN